MTLRRRSDGGPLVARHHSDIAPTAVRCQRRIAVGVPYVRVCAQKFHDESQIQSKCNEFSTFFTC